MDLSRAHDIVHTNAGGMHQNCPFCSGDMNESDVKKAATKIATDKYKPAVDSNVPYNQRLQQYNEKSDDDNKNDAGKTAGDKSGDAGADKPTVKTEKKMSEPFLRSAINIMAFSEKNNEPPTHIKVLPIDTTIQSPLYGPVKLTAAIATDMIKNFNDNVRASSTSAGIPIDFEHGDTQFKDMAAGWIKKLFSEKDGLYADVEWTEPGKDALQKKLYKFYSPGFYLKGYEDPETGKPYENVMTGGGLVNHPGMPHSLPPIVNDEKNHLTDEKKSHIVFVEIKKDNTMKLPEIIAKAKADRTDEEQKFVEAHKGELTFAQAKTEGFAADAATTAPTVAETPKKEEASNGEIKMSEAEYKDLIKMKEERKLEKMVVKVKEITFSDKGVRLPADQVEPWAKKIVKMSEAEQTETLDMLKALPVKEIFHTYGSDDAMNFSEENPQIVADTLTKAKIKEAKDKGETLSYGDSQNLVFKENPKLKQQVFGSAGGNR
jgi:phage I-like protein